MKLFKFFFLLSLGSLLFTGCANTEKVSGSRVTPGAEGKVTADKADNGGTELKIEMEHLAQPEKVGAEHYIVWIQPEGSPAFQNLGTLQVDNDLEAEFETVIPYEEFTVLVTPERDIAALSPTGPAIFEQDMER